MTDEQRERRREYFSRYYAEHKEVIKAAAKSWHDAHYIPSSRVLLSEEEKKKRKYDRTQKWVKENKLHYLELANRACKASRLRHLDKWKARSKVRHAIVRGKLIRAAQCSGCGLATTTQAHHHNGYDFAHALDVVWLCKECHLSCRPH